MHEAKCYQVSEKFLFRYPHFFLRKAPSSSFHASCNFAERGKEGGFFSYEFLTAYMNMDNCMFQKITIEWVRKNKWILSFVFTTARTNILIREETILRGKNCLKSKEALNCEFNTHSFSRFGFYILWKVNQHYVSVKFPNDNPKKLLVMLCQHPEKAFKILLAFQLKMVQIVYLRQNCWAFQN